MFLAAIESDSDEQKVLYIYKNYYSLMAYIVETNLGRCDEVTDVAQECMLRIIDNIDCIDMSDENRLRGFFVILARNAAIDFLKKKKRCSRFNPAFNPEVNFSTVENSVVRTDVYERVKSIICSLPEIYRDVCMLRYVNEFREKEISLLLDLPVKTVNQRIFRGKQMLRERIIKEKLYEHNG